MRWPRKLVGMGVLALVCSTCVRLQEPDEGFACDTHADCTSGERCSWDGAERYRCLATEPCGTLGVCYDDRTCVQGWCVKAPCANAADSRCFPYVCSADTYLCKGSCASDTDCLFGKICELDACQDPECTAISATASCNGYACDTGRCRTECSGPGHCADGFACEGGRCVEL